jgi:hypothetical protein
MTRQKPSTRFKICNVCGDDTDSWTLEDNAPICKYCKPIKKLKLLTETGMINKILEKGQIKLQ